MTRNDGALDGGWLSLTTSPTARSTTVPEVVPVAAARRSSNNNSSSGLGSGSGSSSGSGSGVSTIRQRRTSAGGQPPAARRRRSSSLSDYSQEARELLDPTPAMTAADALRQQRPTSGWDSLPLAFALLPAVGGLLVQGGSAFVTDLMLLALGAIFLHWSVTQPWVWYHSARQVREDQQTSVDYAVDSDVDVEGHNDGSGVDDKDTARSTSPGTLEDVPEEGEEGEDVKKKREAAEEAKSQERSQHAERQRFRAGQEAALRELHRHEVLALLSCFVAPVLGACLLHGLRGQLTRPSEGLISSYNLTIFILGAEVRPLRHLIQLVRARTLHLQRVVNANPYREEEERYRKRRAEEEKAQNETLAGVVQRLADLEGHVQPGLAGLSSRPSTSSRREHDQLLLDLRAQLQPELDMLARALQRTHKQQTLLESQLAELQQATDKQVDEAASLAQASGQQKRNNWLRKAGFWLLSIVSAALNTVLWPFRTALAAVLYVPRRVVVLLLSVKPPAQIRRADKINGASSKKARGDATFDKVVSSKGMSRR
ncbi:hypothetical protein CMQ_7333 [Grosmannia clavigera kw1407]|uniref:Uncharacterized protein n=1 Tax=Grosmannia clavigera (strain kw1407 / UAMH 11150) TaxID=655863 RepID=F0XPZ1_GROCL|nr:uncharacterized protein CMQ_7333 [Grosmannia clavigera kw1407]EFX00331.1 hypothetical protein CMQ_7333 [Grosmannia clavigera kw1407]